MSPSDSSSGGVHIGDGDSSSRSRCDEAPGTIPVFSSHSPKHHTRTVDERTAMEPMSAANPRNRPENIEHILGEARMYMQKHEAAVRRAKEELDKRVADSSPQGGDPNPTSGLSHRQKRKLKQQAKAKAEAEAEAQEQEQEQEQVQVQMPNEGTLVVSTSPPVPQNERSEPLESPPHTTPDRNTIPSGQGPQDRNWRSSMMDNTRRSPQWHFSQLQQQPHHQQDHHQSRGLQQPYSPYSFLTTAGPSRQPLGPRVDPDLLGEPNPHSQPTAWEHWALLRIIRRDWGLTDHEIGFLLLRDRADALERWG